MNEHVEILKKEEEDLEPDFEPLTDEDKELERIAKRKREEYEKKIFKRLFPSELVKIAQDILNKFDNKNITIKNPNRDMKIC
ncbi:MAG: hypothetical protein OEY49_20060 [Candidatus Heimdallarchaeota archaeon]|nr:hypothetical protein [Candidatus Heimdallarchaeota archaeon]